MAYTEQELIGALRKAHAAGDTRAAQAIAKRIAESRGQGTPKTMEELTPGLSTNPTDGMTNGAKFAAGAGKSLRDTGLGMVQFAASGGPYAFIANAFRPEAQRSVEDLVAGRGPQRHALDYAGKVEDWATGRIMANAQADDALTDTGAGFAGNVTGTVAQMLAPAGVAAGAGRVAGMARAQPALNAVTRALMPTSVKGAALQGAALGASQPVREGDSRSLQTLFGAGAGAMGGALPRVAGAALRGVNRIVEPLREKGIDNIIGRTIQRFAQNPAQIQNLPDPITGFAPTLAEATIDPGIAQLQRAAMSKSPEVASELFSARQAANQQRLSALQQFAGDKAKRQAAMDAIEQTEDAAYGAVRKVDGVDVAPVIGRIDAILKGPEGKRKAVRQALAEAREAMMRDDGTPETSANMLLGARGAIRDLLEGRGENQAGKLAQKELIAVRDELDAAIRRVAPQIDTALDARRKGMAPVNEMDAMQELLGRATGDVMTPSGSLAPAIKPAAFMRDGDNLEQMARAGTGFRKATEDVFSPQAQEAIHNVRVGLARQQYADTAAKVPGSPTAQFLAGQNIMEGILGQPQPGTFTSALAKLGASMVDKPYALAGIPERLNIAMARVLTNPQEAQAILARLPPPDRVLLERAIGRLSGPIGAGAFPAAAAPAPLDIGTVSGYDPNDPRYRGGR